MLPEFFEDFLADRLCSDRIAIPASRYFIDDFGSFLRRRGQLNPFRFSTRQPQMLSNPYEPRKPNVTTIGSC
jgi:hypothetical protein